MAKKTLTRASAALVQAWHRDQRGAVLFWFLGLFTLFLVGMVLVVDFGVAFADRRDQQKNVDAMVLAGVQELTDDPAAATLRAEQWAARNGVDVATETVSITVDNSCWSDHPLDDPLVMDSISADVSRPARLFVASELGLDTFNVGAHAKACVGSLNKAEGLRPWALSVLNSDCFDFVGDDPNDALDYAPLYGSECILRLESPSSQVGSIRLGDDEGDECNENGGGAAKYVENILEGSGASCEIGEIVDTEPGLQVGPTLSALEDLLATEGLCDSVFGNPSDGIDSLSEVFDPEDVIPSPDVVFVAKNCGFDDDPATPDSPRFMTLVLIDEWDSSQGFDSQPILGFAGFFLDRCEEVDDEGNVVATYLKCDPSGGAGANMQIVGRFIQYMQLGGDPGPVSPFGSRVAVLVE